MTYTFDMTLSTNSAKTKKQLGELVAVLTLQFILGVLLTTVIEFEPDASSLSQKIVLIAHMFLGGYLLVIAAIRIIRSYQWKSLIAESWIGLFAIVVAFGAGSISAQNGNEWAALIMSLGFVVAFLAYGKSLLATNK